MIIEKLSPPIIALDTNKEGGIQTLEEILDDLMDERLFVPLVVIEDESNLLFIESSRYIKDKGETANAIAVIFMIKHDEIFEA